MSTQRFDKKHNKTNPHIDDEFLILDNEDKVSGIPEIKKLAFKNAFPSVSSPNRIIVNRNLTQNTEGTSYATLSAAINYVNTQSPTITSSWSISIQGNYEPTTTESVKLPNCCSIVGEGNNVMSNVKIDVNPTIMDVTEDQIIATLTHISFIVFKGEINSTHDPEEPSVKIFQFKYATVSPSNVSVEEMMGNYMPTMLHCIHSYIYGGDFENVMMCEIHHSTIMSLWSDINLNVSASLPHGQRRIIQSIIVSDYDMTPEFSVNLDDSTVGETTFIINKGEFKGSFILSNCSLQFDPRVFDSNIVMTNCAMLLNKNPSFDPFTDFFVINNGQSIEISQSTIFVFTVGGFSEPINFKFDVSTQGSLTLNNLVYNGWTIGSFPGYSFSKTGSGDAYLTLEGMHQDQIASIAGGITVTRRNCLWDDAATDDDSNFYSAQKIHDLI